MRIFENSYDLMKKNDLSKIYWKGLESMFIYLTNMKGFNIFWDDRKHWYGEEFKTYMEANVISIQSPQKINVPGNYQFYKKTENDSS